MGLSNPATITLLATLILLFLALLCGGGWTSTDEKNSMGALNFLLMIFGHITILC